MHVASALTIVQILPTPNDRCQDRSDLILEFGVWIPKCLAHTSGVRDSLELQFPLVSLKHAVIMLSVYWVCFAVGGTFVLLAVLSGLDGVDFGDSDVDTPLDDDIELTESQDQSPPSLFQPQKSAWRDLLSIFATLRFWTFALCFFGLTGLVLSHLPVQLPSALVAIAAVFMGILCGSLVAGSLRLLQKRHTDSLVRSDDLVGAMGTVEVPFDNHSRGKVRLLVKGSLIDMLASTDEARPFKQGDRVLVVGLDQNHLWVVAAPNDVPREN